MLHDKYLLLCIQCETPGVGHWTCPKHVEFFIRNRFEKQCVSLVFIIRIYHDARSYECQICIDTLKTRNSVK